MSLALLCGPLQVHIEGENATGSDASASAHRDIRAESVYDVVLGIIKFGSNTEVNESEFDPSDFYEASSDEEMRCPSVRSSPSEYCAFYPYLLQ